MTPGFPVPSASSHERRVQRGHVAEGTHHGVPDEVGEADLGPGRARQLVVEHEAVDLEQAGRHRADARRRGHAQAGLHVGHDARGRAPQDGGLLLGRLGRRSRWGRCRLRSGALGLVPGAGAGGLGCGHRGGAVVGEELPPAVADRGRIGQETVVHVVDQPGIGPERASRATELRHGSTLPAAVGPGGRVGSVSPAHELSGRPPPDRAAGIVTAPGAATVVFVHGSLDRGDSFRMVMRRLPELATIAYDRRGYQGSRGGGVVDLGGHVQDLLLLAEEARSEGGGPVVAVGHSLGGVVVVGAALAEPGAFDAIGAYEPPMPWLGFRRPPGRRGPGLARRGGRSRRGGRALLLPDGEPGRLGPPQRGGPGGAPRRRSGPGRRPAQRAWREPTLRRRSARRAVRLRHGWADDAAASPRHRAVARGARPRRGRLRDLGRAARRAPVAPGPLRRADPPRGGAGGQARRTARPRRTAARRPPPSRSGRRTGASGVATASPRTPPPCPRSSCR